MRFLGLEMKRVLTTKRTWILLAAALVFSGMLAYIPVTFEEVTYTDEPVSYTHLTLPTIA